MPNHVVLNMVSLDIGWLIVGKVSTMVNGYLLNLSSLLMIIWLILNKGLLMILGKNVRRYLSKEMRVLC